MWILNPSSIRWTMNKKTFSQKNERRIALNIKALDVGLSPKEAIELVELTKECTDYVNNKYPIDYSLLEELEAKVEKQESWLKRFIKRWRKK